MSVPLPVVLCKLHDQLAAEPAAPKPEPRDGAAIGLASSAAHHVVAQWIDDAVELLQSMRYTCALDITDEYPDGITERGVGLVLGVSGRAARTDIERAGERLRARMREQFAED